MKVVVAGTPALAVSFEEAQQHLRVDGDDQAAVEMLLAVAQGNLEGPGGWLGCSIGLQALEVDFEGEASERIGLPYAPIVSVEAVTVTAVDGSETVLPENDYSLFADHLTVKASSIWSQQKRARIRYQAGYENAPAQLKAAILLMTGDLYRQFGAEGQLRAFETSSAFREEFADPEKVNRVTLSTVERLVAPFRRYV